MEQLGRDLVMLLSAVQFETTVTQGERDFLDWTYTNKENRVKDESSEQNPHVVGASFLKTPANPSGSEAPFL